jgi:hypothetical protein
VLTPGNGGETLTFDQSGKGITQGGSSGHEIAVSGGDVYLVSGSTYTVESVSGNVGTLVVTDVDFIVDNLVLADGVSGGIGDSDSPAPQLILVAPTSDGAVLKGTGKVVAGKTKIAAGDGTANWAVVGADAADTVIIAADSITGTTSGTGVTLTAGANAAFVIEVAAGGTLEIDTDTEVNLGAVGTLKLNSKTEAEENGAKLTGAGKIVAGATEIVGGESGWQAVATAVDGNVTIAATSADASSITADAATTVLTATGAGATITQLTGGSNGLTIAMATTIDLAGDTNAAAGSITLTAGSNPGKLIFGDTTSKVLAGAGTGTTLGSGALESNVTVGGQAIIATSLTKADFENDDANSKIVKIGGVTAGNFTAGIGVSPTTDVVIDSTAAAATSSN